MTKRAQLSCNATGPPADRVEAFLTLIAQHQRRIQHFVRSLVPNSTEADDILQETNLVLWREFHQFELGSNFAAWSGAIAFHQVLAWRKRRQRERLVFSEEFLTAVSDELRDNTDQHEERSRILTHCIERIPSHHRELLRLRYTEGRSIETIAASLDRTTDAVYRMLSRIRQALFDCTSRSLAADGRTAP
jgi:RNA polymerase sigma-70 factor, ECF subfamily